MVLSWKRYSTQKISQFQQIRLIAQKYSSFEYPFETFRNC